MNDRSSPGWGWNPHIPLETIISASDICKYFVGHEVLLQNLLTLVKPIDLKSRVCPYSTSSYKSNHVLHHVSSNIYYFILNTEVFLSVKNKTHATFQQGLFWTAGGVELFYYYNAATRLLVRRVPCPALIGQKCRRRVCVRPSCVICYVGCWFSSWP
jgi:hypothetical protein